ncbi:unnamed protein product, partial [Amoebophrya sp. A120]|eukprot:GSA120T00021988001.1
MKSLCSFRSFSLHNFWRLISVSTCHYFLVENSFFFRHYYAAAQDVPAPGGADAATAAALLPDRPGGVGAATTPLASGGDSVDALLQQAVQESIQTEDQENNAGLPDAASTTLLESTKDKIAAPDSDSRPTSEPALVEDSMSTSDAPPPATVVTAGASSSATTPVNNPAPPAPPPSSLSFDSLDLTLEIDNPCWTPGYTFAVCCNTDVFGERGNMECWDESFNFNICCVEERWLRSQNMTSNPTMASRGGGLESAQFIRRREDLRTCLSDYEGFYTKVMQWSGFRESPFGDPASCKAVGRRFFWVILNRVMMGFCAPESCNMNEWYIAGPLIAAWTGKMGGSKFGCLEQEKEFGMYDTFPPLFSRPPSATEMKAFQHCEENMRRYFPSSDVIRLRTLLQENRLELDERAKDLNFNVKEHHETWRVSPENWFHFKLIGAPVLVASLLEFLLGLLACFGSVLCTCWCRMCAKTAQKGQNSEDDAASVASRTAAKGTSFSITSLLTAPIRLLRRNLLQPLALQTNLSELFAGPTSPKVNSSLSLVRIFLCLTVIYVHTVEAFEWENHSSEQALLQLRYWPLFVLCHCGHRVNTLFTCLSTFLALKSIRSTNFMRDHVGRTSRKNASGDEQGAPAKTLSSPINQNIFFTIFTQIRLLLKQALQRITRQSPVMLFWTFIVMRVFAKDIPWRPSETITVWYDYRVKVCHMSQRWLYSSFYLHAWLTQSVTDESICHNTAIFEAEFQVVMFFIVFSSFAYFTRRLVSAVF